MVQIDQSSPQQWSEYFTAAYMGLPPPTRWSTQRANGQYKDHLVGQLTTVALSFKVPYALNWGPLRCYPRSHVALPFDVPKDKSRTIFFKIRWFIDPSDQNEQYHTPLHSEIWVTRSLGAFRAPTSSWRPFGPLDFILRALRALRPCDPRVGDWIVC